MNINLVVLAGRLAAPVEHRSFESGSHLARLLVTVRSEAPVRRVDVVPVTLWDPDSETLGQNVGAKVWVAGAVQRRFWGTDDGRRSRLEVVARHVEFRDEDAEPDLDDAVGEAVGDAIAEAVGTASLRSGPCPT